MHCYWIFSIQWILVMIYNNFEKSAFVMGFSYLWKAFLAFSSASQIWFIFFFSWYIFQLCNNILRFWHTVSSRSLKKRELFNNNDWKTKKWTNKQRKQTFLIKTIPSCEGGSDTSAEDSAAAAFTLVFFNLFRNHLLALQCTHAKGLATSIFLSTSPNTLPQFSTFPKLPNICGPF